MKLRKEEVIKAIKINKIKQERIKLDNTIKFYTLIGFKMISCAPTSFGSL